MKKEIQMPDRHIRKVQDLRRASLQDTTTARIDHGGNDEARGDRGILLMPRSQKKRKGALI